MNLCHSVFRHDGLAIPLMEAVRVRFEFAASHIFGAGGMRRGNWNMSTMMVCGVGGDFPLKIGISPIYQFSGKVR